MNNLIGKVIKIISNKEIMINLGSKDSLTVGKKFIIFSEGEMVKDPETGEELEVLQIIKGEVIVKQVQEKFSICETPTHYIPYFSLGTILGGLNEKATTPIQDILNVREKDITPLIEEDTIVKIGDKVKEVNN